MTVGRSEQANTLEVESDLKVRSTVGCVPSVTFFRSLNAPGGGGKEKQGPAVTPDWRGESGKNCLDNLHANMHTVGVPSLM